MNVNTIMRCTSVHEGWSDESKNEIHLECVLDSGTIPNLNLQTDDARFYPGKHYRVAVEITGAKPEEVPVKPVEEPIDLSKV